jgi:hypothetical protein
VIYESRASEGASQAVSLDRKSHSAAHNRTTTLNNVAVTKTTTLKKKGKGKTDDMVLASVPISLSDEDDSQERDVALNSPEKGKDFRKSSKVRMITQIP